jgi:hypothetical protein
MLVIDVDMDRLARPIARFVGGTLPDVRVPAAGAVRTLDLLLASSAGRWDQRLAGDDRIVAMKAR